MTKSKFDKLRNGNVTGALNIVNQSVEKYEADITGEHQRKIEEEKKKKSDDDEKIVRAYSLTKSQIRMIQEKKLEEIGLTLSDIVGKAIEFYYKNS